MSSPALQYSSTLWRRVVRPPCTASPPAGHDSHGMALTATIGRRTWREQQQNEAREGGEGGAAGLGGRVVGALILPLQTRPEDGCCPWCTNKCANAGSRYSRGGSPRLRHRNRPVCEITGVGGKRVHTRDSHPVKGGLTIYAHYSATYGGLPIFSETYGVCARSSS